MRSLAIETATEACSVALFDSGELVDARHEVLGRGHAERLVPMIAELPDKGRADVIRVSLGPGSFTGVRIGLAVARALGIAWGAEVRGYPTLALVAALAQDRDPEGGVTVCMTGGHGEWFLQDFDPGCVALGEAVSLPPAQAATRGARAVIAGNRASELAALSGDGHRAIDMLPDAKGAQLMPGDVFTETLSPLYGRAPDAKLPGA